MLAFLRGNFVNKSPAKVIVDVNGVGYDVQISLNTYEAIQNKENGLLFTYLHITENSQVLFGFSETKEKDVFIHLISISGVGASTARMMLSGMKPDELAKCIVSGNVNELVKIKGIGKKTAELLVVGLRDKLSGFVTEMDTITYSLNPLELDAVNALMALGIGKPMAEKAVKKVIQSNADLSIQEIIKQALKNI